MIKNRKLRVRNILAGALSAVMVLTSCPSTALATDEVFFEDTAATEAVVENAETVESTVLDTQSAQEDIMSADEDAYELTVEAEETESEAEESLIVDTDDTSVETLNDGIEPESEASDAETVDEIVPEETSVDEFEESEEEELLSAAEDAEESDALVEENLSAAAVNEEITVAGQRNFFYTNFTAELSDITVKVAASNLFVGRGATMSARLLSGEEYIEKIEAQNYGKILVGPRAIELTFYDAQKNEFTPIGLSVFIEAKKTDAESYALYRAGGNTVRRVGTSAKPAFEFYTTYAETYILSGLKKDDVLRAEGKRVNGKTTFALKQDGTDISVSAPSGAFYGSISMEAEMVSADVIKEQVEGVLKEGTAIESITAFDISFHADSKEDVAPNKEVTVTIKTPLNADSDYKLIHIPDEGEGEPEEVTNAVFTENGVTFTSKDFSVYAVVETGEGGDEARLAIEFYGYNQDEEDYDLLSTVYVKNADLKDDDNKTAKQKLEEIVYDPGVIQLSQGYLFAGWNMSSSRGTVSNPVFDGRNYDTDTTPLTIEDIRQYLLSADFEEIKEGQVLTVYSMIYKTYNIQYLASDNVSLGSYDLLLSINDTVYKNYNIALDYNTTSQEEHFEGWNVTEGATNISNATYEGEPVTAEPYQVGTTMDISGDVTFSVNVAEGHWLIFDENGDDATYNAPVFIKKGEVPTEPALDMVRSGYDFAGWWTGKPASVGADPTGEEYNFDNAQPLTDTLTLYAKWVVKETTTYTLIVWKQSVSDNHDVADADKTYDYAFSKQISETANKEVSSLDLSEYTGLAGNRNYTVDGNSHSFYGFKYNTTKGVSSKQTKVLPNGTTVVNLYYDREIVTYDFWLEGYTYTESNSTDSGYYYIPDGNGDYTLVLLYRHNGKWFRDRNYSGIWPFGEYHYSNEYSGIVYERSEGWSIRETFTGLYEQRLSKYDYTWPTDYRWFISSANNENTFTSIKDMFEESENRNPSNEFHTDYYGRSADFNTEVRHYLQNVDDSWPTEATYTVPTRRGNGMIFRTFSGYTANSFRIKLPSNVTTYYIGTSYSGNNLVNPESKTAIGGWTEWLPRGTGVEYNGNNNFHEIGTYAATEGGIEFRYTRNSYNLTYMVGRFVNHQNEILNSPITGKMKSVPGIHYEASLASYGKDGSNYFDPDSYDSETDEHDWRQKGFVFEGWYIDESCTTPYDFSDKTMPLNGITVYGKWRQIQYRVFLHPNALNGEDRDTTLTWGSESQKMTFRVSYGDKISIPTGLRDNYDFIGWYMDEACLESPFNAATKLTEWVDTPYDMSVDMTDVMDKWGLFTGTPYNSDITGYEGNPRFWIENKLELYGKWSAKLDGADGIGIVYVAEGKDEEGNLVSGTDAPTNDTKLYKDNVDAIAQTGSKPISQDYQFLYWVLQTYNEQTGDYEDKVEGGKLCTYFPGNTFTVLKNDAKTVVLNSEEVTVTDEETGETQTVTKIKSATYTIRLRPMYGPKEVPTDTHIIWYGNGGTVKTPVTKETDKKYVVTGEEGSSTVSFTLLQINEKIPAIDNETFEREGYEFLGWARLDEPALAYNENTKTIDPSKFSELTGENELTEEDLWLAYDAETDSYYEVVEGERGTRPITEVAADESEPYHALYAVWVGTYTIYHSGKNASDAGVKSVHRVTGESIKPYQFSDTSLLYGGYYVYNPIKSQTNTVCTPNSEKYDGKNWTWTTPKTGSTYLPKPGDIIYIKEVPVDYLRPYVQYTYIKTQNIPTTNQLTGLIFLSSIDDKKYRSSGYTLTRGDQKATITASYTIKYDDGEIVETLTPSNVISRSTNADFEAGSLNKLTYYDASNSDYFKKGSFTITPYFVTPDSVTVHGTKTWIVTLDEDTDGLLKTTTISKVESDYEESTGEG